MFADLILCASFLFILFDGHKWLARKYVDTLHSMKHQ